MQGNDGYSSINSSQASKSAARGGSERPTSAAAVRARPPSAGGLPPPSSMPQPPPSAQRRTMLAVSSPSVGTGAAAAARAQPRPLTQQGLASAGGSGAAPAGRRQVLDRAYYVNELRQKRQELLAATAEMREELEALQHKQAAVGRAEKLSAQLRREVRSLQEALADSNIIIDKAGSHAPLQHIHTELAEVRAHNDAQEARAEELLSQRLELEARAKQADSELAAMQASLDRQLASMPPSARQAHAELTAEQGALLSEVTQLEADAAALDTALADAEGELGRSAIKQRALELQEQLRLLGEQQRELAAAEEETRAPPEQQRDALLARIKRDNAAAEAAAGQARALQEEVRRLEAAAAAAPAHGTAHGGTAPPRDEAEEASRRENYAELLAKERELLAFMDAFPQRRAAKSAELDATRDAVNAALERASRASTSVVQRAKGKRTAQDGPTSRQPRTGNDGPGSELAALRADLDKVIGLGGKVAAELSTQRERAAALRAEVERYAGVDEARASRTAEREGLEQQRQQLLARREAARAALADQAWQSAARESELQAHAAWPAIDSLEAQLRSLQAEVEASEAAACEHEAAADFEPQRQRLLGMVAGANTALVAAVLSMT